MHLDAVPPNVPDPDDPIAGALNRLLAPLARLCLAHGVSFAAAEEMLKSAFVQEARALQPGLVGHGTVSRISTATGIRRREVTRLLQPDGALRQAKHSLATEVFARWTTDPAYRDAEGAPVPLRRQGPEPSFETLAQAVTRDVHPRSLLDELLRLGIAALDDTDLVTLKRADFVPKDDSRQMLGFLADNVGDHFDAAVANVVKGGGEHLEQAIFADEISAASLQALRPLVTAQWQGMCDVLIPALAAFIEADADAGRPQDQRVRIGLYSFSESTGEATATATDTGAGTPETKGADR